MLFAVSGAAVPAARADDRIDVTTTWFQERREGGKGGLTVVHPQVDLGVDIGSKLSLGLGYSADVVSGATAAVYSIDSVSSATPFTDTRHEGRLSMGLTGRRASLTVTGSAGEERDYTSISVSSAASVDLPGRNTTFALSYTHNFDQICDHDNAMAGPLERRPLSGLEECEKNVLFGVDNLGSTVWHHIAIDTTQATLTQNLSPTTVMQLGLYGQVLQGFQGNPYRRVRVSGTEAQETVPEIRGRLAVTARLSRFLPSIRGAVGLSGRGYSDTWGVRSATAELDYSQYAGKSLLLRVRTRVYQQTAATFFKDAFFYDREGPANAYFTGDRELAPLRHAIVGAKLSYLKTATDEKKVWGFLDSLDLNLKGDILLFDELAAQSTAANPAGVEGQFISSRGLFDGFVLQVGLLLRY